VRTDSEKPYEISDHSIMTMSTRETESPERSFKAAMRIMAAQHQCTIGHFQRKGEERGNIFDDEGLMFDDVFAVLYPRAAEALKKRIADRLAEMFCGCNAWSFGAIVMIKEDGRMEWVDIWVIPFMPNDNKDDKASPAFLAEMVDLIMNIRHATSGKSSLGLDFGFGASLTSCTPRNLRFETLLTDADKGLASGKEALFGYVLECYRTRLHEYLARLRKVFDDHKTSYEQMVSDFLGLFDEVASVKDYEVSGSLIRFHNMACIEPAGGMSREICGDIVSHAKKLLLLEDLEIRLRPVLGIAFAKELYATITVLARPKQVYETIARALWTFRTVNIHRGPPQLYHGGTRCVENTSSNGLTSPPSTIKAPSPVIPTPSPAITRSEPATEPEAATGKSSNSIDILGQAKKYLAPHERNIGVNLLQPISKQSAYMLVISLINGSNPLPEWNAYHHFGYAACRDEDECQRLGGTYRAILRECESESAALLKLYKALDDNALMNLFDDHKYSLIRQHIPDLERYLNTKAPERETVWTLIQFIRAKDQTDPPKSLLGGYRFEFCKTRENVQVLKDLYADILKKMHPLQLHSACAQGRLLETVMQTASTPLNKDVERMLRPRALMPGEAYEGTAMNTVGGTGGVFKKRQKWTETF
jgi:hypothetical protein